MFNIMDALVVLMLLMGVLLGASQRLVRVLMSILIIGFAIIATPAVYQAVGKFISALLMVPRLNGDGIGFLLTSLFFIIVLELIMRRSFKGTFLLRIGVLDQISGALVGPVWAVLTASAILMPLTYVGAISGPSTLVPLIQTIFRPIAMVTLRLIYPVGFAPIIDQFIG